MMLSRSANGRTIHARNCSRSDDRYPWVWAEGVSRHDILDVMYHFGYRQCKMCTPMTKGSIHE